MENIGSFRRKKKTNRGARRKARCKTTESSGSRDNGDQCCGPIMGRLRIGFLRGQLPPQPEAFTIVCGASEKRKNREPSAETPSSKKPRKPASGTRPVIDMVLYQGEKGHPIKVLLDTGCSIALINEKTTEKLGLEWWKHKQAHSIESFTGESVKGAGQCYTEPLLLQHRKHFTREKFEISPMDTEIDVFLPFEWISSHPPQGACNGTGSGGLPVAGRTRAAACRRRAAGRGQGRRRADGAQRGQDKGGGEQSARSGDRTRAARSERTACGEREVWERKCGSSIRKLRKQVVA